MKAKLTTTFDALRKAGACESGYKKLATYLGGVTKYGSTTPINLLTILENNGVSDCLWALRAVDHPERDRISRYIACDCAEVVLHLYEKHYPNDGRPRNAITVARRFADGQASDDELTAAEAAALAAARAAAESAAESAARAAAEAAALAAAEAAAENSAWAAALASARTAAEAAARAAQRDIIKSYLEP